MSKMRIPAALALASVLGCADGGGRIVAPEAPVLLAGPTATVTVSCPANMVDGQSGQCSAAGYDSNGTFTMSSPVTWGTSTPSLVSVSSGGSATAAHLASGTAVVQATIEGVTGSTNISISQSDLAVSISTPSSIKPNTQCYWWASVSGGTASYTYSWTRSGGFDTSNQSDFYTQSASSFTIYLTVTDAVGTQRSTSKAITVTSSAHVCPI